MCKKICNLSLFVILALSISLTAFASEQVQHEGFGLDFAYLDAMSNEELLALYAPFAAIINEYNAKYGLCTIQYGIEMIIPDPDCDLQRPFLINAISSSTLEEFRVNTMEHAHVLVDLKRLNAVSRTLLDAAEEIYLLDGVDMFDELFDLTHIVTSDVEILNQVYELLENDVAFYELIEIIDTVDIDLPVAEIDPLQTTADTRTVSRSDSTWNNSTTTIQSVQVWNVSWNRWEFWPAANAVMGTPSFRFPALHTWVFQSHRIVSRGATNQLLTVDFSGQHAAPGDSRLANITFHGIFRI